MPISNDIAVNRVGMGMIGEVDNGCDGFVAMDGGYEMTDFESKQSDEILMLVMVMMRDDG